MLNLSILSSDDRMLSSLSRHLRATYGDIELHQIDLSRLPLDDALQPNDIPHVFDHLCSRLETDLGSVEQLWKSIAVFDLPDRPVSSPSDLNPLDTTEGWQALLGMLILAFPEIHWVIRTLRGPYEVLEAVGRDAHQWHEGWPPLAGDASHEVDGREEGEATNGPLDAVIELHRRGFCTLFDPTGLRNRIRRAVAETQNNEGKPVALLVPIRSWSAAAVDEEEAYAYFNAYAAYRFGYRAWPVTSWRLTKQLFSEKEGAGVRLLLEDLYLGFADKDRRLSLSDLEQRDGNLPGLNAPSVRRRVLITVGHGGKTWEKNREYIARLRQEQCDDGSWRRVEVLYKPLAGIFQLWEQIGLLRRDGKPVPAGEGNEQFVWPPRVLPDVTDEGHSAPGRLLAVSQRLINRSEAVLQMAQTVPDALYAATLALEAKELLSGKTPTTALEALSLQHRAEVTAESMFYGVEHHLEVKSRFRDLEREVAWVAQWFHSGNRERSALNARIAIIEEMAHTFRERNQFDEERECQAEARRLRSRLWAKRSLLRRPAGWVLAYLNFAMNSLAHLIGVVLVWVLAFAGLYQLLLMTEPTPFGETLAASALFFFAFESHLDSSVLAAVEHDIVLHILLIFQAIVAFTHLSLLIAYIYTIIARR